ncbi:MAG: dUTP diphosphatase [Clostridiales bacterium]|nr:dUTP diphosphatase [Clostridiales bacterium]
MKLKVVSKSGLIPKYETMGSAGMDLKAYIKEPIVLKPMERMLVSTGIFIELPLGYEGQVRARSGLAIKKGIGLVNSIGTIDSDYRGELKIPVINFGSKDYEIKSGDRIAQLVIAKHERAEIQVVEELSDTKRGAGGFGHTGV